MKTVKVADSWLHLKRSQLIALKEEWTQKLSLCSRNKKAMEQNDRKLNYHRKMTPKLSFFPLWKGVTLQTSPSLSFKEVI